ncbi:MAG TPA: ArdC-like ssDNA-binding domain-containing protein [archaeon]|nr:ArdC-like ssDNA-binding domain-containing protein [archaeon]
MNPLQNLEKMTEEYIRQLAEETDEFRKSAAFREYLDTMARFWQYSYRNQLLIHVQKPHASRVAGFRKWNDLGRHIKAGSKAIKILAPYQKKVKEKDLATGEEKEVTRTYFWPVNVFDISQTDGKELPKIDIEIQGDDHKPLLDKLLDFCKTHNITVEFKDLGINGLYGYSQGGKIAIDSNQSVNTQVNTLIHEIAHELTHYSEEGKKFSKQEKEIQAEATTYTVTKALELDNKSPKYLALYTADKDKILESLEVISSTARQLLEYVITGAVVNEAGGFLNNF